MGPAPSPEHGGEHHARGGPLCLQCPLCGGTLATGELGEAMVQAVLQADGFVEMIAPDPRLAAYEGVGALLRYT